MSPLLKSSTYVELQSQLLQPTFPVLAGKPSNLTYKSASPELIVSLTCTPEQEAPQSIR